MEKILVKHTILHIFYLFWKQLLRFWSLMAFFLLPLMCFISLIFCFLSPDSVCLDNLPDQLWCCLAMCISSGVAVFSDFLYDFFDYPLHKFLYSGKSNSHQLFLAFCSLYLTGKLLQKDILEMSFCYPSLTCMCS